MKPILLTLLYIIPILPVQADETMSQRYAQFAQKINDWVWNMPQKEFSLTEVSASLKKYDIAALAEYDSLCFDHRFYTELPPFATASDLVTNILGLRFSAKPDFHCITHLHRIRMMINSDSAAHQLSSICYPHTYATNDDRLDVVGIQVVKPNGQVRFIDTTPYLQPAPGGKTGQRPERIAIDGLCQGDILDVFYYSVSIDKVIPKYSYTFYFSKRMPTMNVKYRISTDQDSYLRYRYLNWNKPFDVFLSEHTYFQEMRFDELILMPKRPTERSSAMTICAQSGRHTMTGMFEKRGKGGIEEDRSLVREWNECFLND